MSLIKKIARAAVVAAACALAVGGAGCVQSAPPGEQSSGLLKDVYGDYFTVGTAVQSRTLNKYSDVLPHFNSVTAETEMKWSRLERQQGAYDYSGADAVIRWAEEHDAAVRGHCLVWYKSLPGWVLAEGTTKSQALARMQAHIDETMRHFGDSVYCWDVVNEAIKDSLSSWQLESGDIWRTGNISGGDTGDWYAVCGEDYVKQAFIYADEARTKYGLDDVELFYNDYALNSANKREACVQLVEMLREDDIPIDGIGMQGHYKLSDYLADPQKFIEGFEESVKTFTGLGLDVHVTELDIRVYENDGDPPAFDSLPLSVELQQAEMYADIFEVLREYSLPWKDGAGCVTNVTVWGAADDSAAWDTEAHKEYPLLFDEEHRPKEAYYSIISF